MCSEEQAWNFIFILFDISYFQPFFKYYQIPKPLFATWAKLSILTNVKNDSKEKSTIISQLNLKINRLSFLHKRHVPSLEKITQANPHMPTVTLTFVNQYMSTSLHE